MSKRTRKKTDGENLPQNKKSHSTELQDKVRKHVSDINDVITDEDIMNSKLDTKDIAEDAEKLAEDLDNNSKYNDGNQKGGTKSVTPWDVLKDE